MANSTSELKQGYLSASVAYIWWGLIPIYFKALNEVSATEILAHRIAWCVPTVLIIMWVLKKPTTILATLRNPKICFALVISTLLVSNNWFIFTWAVVNDRVLDTSLGYFINPLLSILLGVFLLKEKLSNFQWMAVFVAGLGVLNQIFIVGEIPWLSLALAVTFGLYGLVRKQTNIDSLNGLLIETTFALPFALVAIFYLHYIGQAVFLSNGTASSLLLALGGLITAVPLILFAIGARRLPLYVVGLLQFIAPSMTFLLAIFVYNEAFDWQKAITFGLVWIGLTMYVIDSVIKTRERKSNA